MSWTASAQAPKPAATDAPAATEAVGIPRAPVTINNRELFTLSGASEDEALRRAETVEKRVQRLIERTDEVEKFEPSDVITEDAQPLITLGGEPVLTVTEADVADALVPSQELAMTWGSQLSRVVQGRTHRAHQSAQQRADCHCDFSLRFSERNCRLAAALDGRNFIGALVLAVGQSRALDDAQSDEQRTFRF